MQSGRKALFALALTALAAACGDNGMTDGGDARTDARTDTNVQDNVTQDTVTQDTNTQDVVEQDNFVPPDVQDVATDTGTDVVTTPTCTDAVMNGTETGVDCGGSCAPCADGTACMVAADCMSGVCSGTPMTCAPAQCGDGVMQAGEMCDDGNATNGDGCDDGVGGTCRPTGCGNGVVSGSEVCDDGNAVDGDGCDNNCTMTACGNGVTAGSETCDDGNTAAGDGCSATCAPETGFTCTTAVPSVCSGVCGDGMVVTGEACDQGNTTAGDGCSPTCTLEPGYACTGAPSVCAPVCGDGMTTAPETCDDGNTTSLDGCSSTCRTELTEVEPNEDGTPSTGGSGAAGNDFDATAIANATAQGVTNASAGDAVWVAALATAGDEDVFAITNDTTGSVTLQVDTWNRAMGFGLGTSCGTSSIDTAINLRDMTGAVLVTNDDRVSGSDYCSHVAFVLAPGQTVYAHVLEFGDNAAIPGYALQIRFTPIICGDSMIAGPEQCDDGNTVSGDGCSSTCQFDVGCPTGQTLVNVSSMPMAAIPDNDQVTGVSSTAMVTTAGAVMSLRVRIDDIAHTNNADLDIYLTGPNGVRRELSTDNGSTGDNYVNTLFVDGTATAITAATAPMTGAFRPETSMASTLGTDFRGSNAAGSWTLRVFDDAAANTGTLNAWTLYACVDPTMPYCGDGVRQAAEECDDGNTIDTDACSNLCQITDGCGDGNIDAGEACDDNNITSGDGCSATCTLDITCGAGETPVIITNTTGAAIPDTYSGLISLNDVTTAGLVRNAIVTVDVTHANTGHLDMYLISPFGGQRILSDDNNGVNYTATQFSDAATTAITSATTGAHTGTFRPEQTLAGFNGQSAAGSWVLRIGDDTTGTTGTLNSWSIALCVDTSVTHTCGNGIVETGETCDDGNTTASDGCSNTCQLELNCATGETPVILTSTDGPLLIVDNNPTGVTSTINVAATGNVSRAVVVLNAVGHTFAGDLNFTLLSPTSTMVDLSSGNGSSGDDFLSTVFDDTATTAITSVSSSNAPFRGRFRPEAPLSGVMGQAASGTWQLRVSDTSNADVGVLRSWSIGLCTQ